MNKKENSSYEKSLSGFFYALSEIFATEHTPLINIYQEVVDQISTIDGSPESFAIKLTIDGQEFTSENAPDNGYQHKCDIQIDDKIIGNLMISCFESESNIFTDPVPCGDIKLIEVICKWIGEVTKRNQVKAMISEGDIKFRTLVNDAQEGIYICDVKGTFIYANYSLAKILGGEEPIDVIGKNFIQFLPENRKKELSNQFLRAVETGKVSSIIQTEINKDDGSSGYIEIKPSTFIIDGKICGNQGIVQDVTKRVLKEKTLLHESTHDSLTGLYNQAFFEAEMKRIERGRQFPVSIVVLRLDLPAEMEDDKDNEPIKRTIKRVAHKLFQTYRGDDIVARVGSNEFGILLPNVSEQNVDVIVQRISNNLQGSNSLVDDQPLRYYLGVKTAEKGESLLNAFEHALKIINVGMKNPN